MKQFLRKIVDSISPDWLDLYRQRRWLCREARRLRAHSRTLGSLEEVVSTILQHHEFRAHQKYPEILALLRTVQTLRPRFLLEVGNYRGGTLFLFAHVAAPDAQILAVDIQFAGPRRQVYPHFASGRQKISCLQGDSHSQEMRDKVVEWLHGNRLDFLFIDGDHSFAGVKRDFELYGPLVRDGGIIAFHDILPDFRTRYGTPTDANVGEVPRFWAELKEQGVDAEEFIEDPGQDGMGIGVIRQRKSATNGMPRAALPV